MIIYGLLKLVMVVLEFVAGIFGELIPSFPDVITSLLDTIGTMINGGISFISYFFHVPVLVALIGLVISWHSFKVVKDAIMKVIGHFLGN